MAILLHSTFSPPGPWIEAFAELLPDDDVVTLDLVDDPADIEFAVVWDLPVEEFARFHNLRAILLTGSGGSHLKPVEALPAGVPVVRLVDRAVADDMAAYSLHWVIHFQRGIDRYLAQQTTADWVVHDFIPTDEHTVGVLGYGNVGARVADRLLANGYPVRAWSRSPKPGAPVETFTGPGELGTFLSGCRAVINVLPLTPETRNVLDADRLATMPSGAALINIGRGGTVDDAALIAALDSGHLNGVALDVFREEPLPDWSPYWNHPRVAVTPHISGAAQPRSSTSYIAANIERIRRGETPFPLFVAERGY
ncbi:MAG: glyoxylate/hydroxypyruvate reductase A [Actinomycetota bacterium]